MQKYHSLDHALNVEMAIYSHNLVSSAARRTNLRAARIAHYTTTYNWGLHSSPPEINGKSGAYPVEWFTSIWDEVVTILWQEAYKILTPTTQPRFSNIDTLREFIQVTVSNNGFSRHEKLTDEKLSNATLAQYNGAHFAPFDDIRNEALAIAQADVEAMFASIRAVAA